MNWWDYWSRKRLRQSNEILGCTISRLHSRNRVSPAFGDNPVERCRLCSPTWRNRPPSDYRGPRWNLNGREFRVHIGSGHQYRLLRGTVVGLASVTPQASPVQDFKLSHYRMIL